MAGVGACNGTIMRASMGVGTAIRRGMGLRTRIGFRIGIRDGTGTGMKNRAG